MQVLLYEIHLKGDRPLWDFIRVPSPALFAHPRVSEQGHDGGPSGRRGSFDFLKPPVGLMEPQAAMALGSTLSESRGVVMALRREDLKPEERERQEALDRSWAQAQRDLADPEFRGYLEESLRRLDAREPAPLLTREEFLAQTQIPDE